MSFFTLILIHLPSYLLLPPPLSCLPPLSASPLIIHSLFLFSHCTSNVPVAYCTFPFPLSYSTVAPDHLPFPLPLSLSFPYPTVAPDHLPFYLPFPLLLSLSLPYLTVPRDHLPFLSSLLLLPFPLFLLSYCSSRLSSFLPFFPSSLLSLSPILLYLQPSSFPIFSSPSSSIPLQAIFLSNFLSLCLSLSFPYHPVPPDHLPFLSSLLPLPFSLSPLSYCPSGPSSFPIFSPPSSSISLSPLSYFTSRHLLSTFFPFLLSLLFPYITVPPDHLLSIFSPLSSFVSPSPILLYLQTIFLFYLLSSLFFCLSLSPILLYLQTISLSYLLFPLFLSLLSPLSYCTSRPLLSTFLSLFFYLSLSPILLYLQTISLSYLLSSLSPFPPSQVNASPNEE
ncbi:hypothetical protein C7M84_008325 [Penaeus vannamei]|uniref:Uncharacterized protein n=1 Tax=Penaeus vannamei TaxID=6689 RepID=A0A3R7MZA8_PENVA|nr:hypothetical protein C7M84_008325 [Penaeus vannamei]